MAANRFKLPLFNPGVSLTASGEKPSSSYHRWWQDAARKLEAAINGIQDALAAAGIALAAADNANNAAAIVTNQAKLATSGMTGLTITATESGGSATITVSNHTRVYGDGTSVVVTGATSPPLLVNTMYVIYYDNPTFSGGAVTYQYSTNIASISQTGVRHVVGQVMTPAVGAPPTDGAGQRPPGYNFEFQL